MYFCFRKDQYFNKPDISHYFRKKLLETSPIQLETKASKLII